MKDSDLLLNQSRTVIPNVKMETMDKMMNDLDRVKENKDILEFKMLSDEGEAGKWDNKTFYFRMKLPMMSERDCIIESHR